MSVIIFLLIGLIAGWLASVLVDGQGYGAFGNIVVGVIGAFMGGYIYQMMGITTYGFWGNTAMAVIGAVVFLFILGLINGRRQLVRSRK